MEMNNCLNGRTVLCQKDRTEGNAVAKYRPITSLPLTWKFLKGVVYEYLYEAIT